MIPVILFIYAVMQGIPMQDPATVLLIPLETKDDAVTRDFSVVIPLTSPENGVLFDLDGDGKKEQVAWTQRAAPAAFLAIDKNKNGRIDNGLELVGTRTVDGGRNGIDSLIRLRTQETSERSASVKSGDQLYERLLLWRDANHNGVSEARELRPVRDVLTRIGLSYEAVNRRDDHGNLFKWQGWMEVRAEAGSDDFREHTSRSRRIYDVALRVR